MGFITIKNDGKKIIETDYFDSELNQAGKFFLSINAGAFRLLVPDVFSEIIHKELQLAEYIEFSKGETFVNILFEDHSDNPYQIQMTHNSLDRIPAEGDRGREDLVFSAWVKKGDALKKISEKRCKFIK